MSAPEEKEANGPNVRKLLTEPLEPGESLRINRGFTSYIDLVRKTERGFSIAQGSFRIYKERDRTTREVRQKTCAEIAAEVDRWLKERRESRTERKAKADKETAERIAYQALAANMREEMTGSPDGKVHIRLGEELEIEVVPSPDGKWRIAMLGGYHFLGGSLSNDEVRGLLARARMDFPAQKAGAL